MDKPAAPTEPEAGHVSIEEFLQGKNDAQKRAMHEAMMVMDAAARRGAALREEGRQDARYLWILVPIGAALFAWAEGLTWTDTVSLVGTIVLVGSILAFPVLCVRFFLRAVAMGSCQRELQRMNHEAFNLHSASYWVVRRRVWVGMKEEVLRHMQVSRPF